MAGYNVTAHSGKCDSSTSEPGQLMTLDVTTGQPHRKDCTPNVRPPILPLRKVPLSYQRRGISARVVVSVSLFAFF